MDEKKEVYTIGDKNYNVITRVTEHRLDKEYLIKLIVKYGIKELQIEDL